jgi:molybdopterin-guanine dinucleotide biosynthesis protein A
MATQAPLGMILAGGQATRMGGGDKALRPFRGGTLLGAVIARLSPQVADLALNANGDPARLAGSGLPVIADSVPGQPGPLAGILAAMDWAAARGAESVLTAPCDTPFLPGDLVPRLLLAGSGGLALAASGGRVHPTAALWPVALRDDLRAALARGERKVRAFTDRYHAAIADFPLTSPDAFANANTPADLAELEAG